MAESDKTPRALTRALQETLTPREREALAIVRAILASPHGGHYFDDVYDDNGIAVALRADATRLAEDARRIVDAVAPIRDAEVTSGNAQGEDP